MAMAKRQQSNPILITLIAFVIVFIIATTAAVIFYVKSEDRRTANDNLKSDLARLISSQESQKGLEQIVGTIPARETAIGVMTEQVDQMVALTVGGPVPNTSAQVKVDNAQNQIRGILQDIDMKYPDIGPYDPNAINLSRTLEKLSSKLDSIIDANNMMSSQYEDLKRQYQQDIQAHVRIENDLYEQVDKYHQEVNEMQLEYANLKTLLDQTTKEQVKNLQQQYDALKDEKDITDAKLSKTEAELSFARERLKSAQAEIEKIMPLPDSNTTAYQPDGKIILVDPQSRIVHINIGSEDRVYPGLTFEVYDKSQPIPKSGRGKAEIEAFDVGKTISSARIVTTPNPRNPIIEEDVIANLIWDKNAQNSFVVAGDFENGDSEKIKDLIRKWGGNVENDVTVNTDYIVLGNSPRMLARPTIEQQSIDPTSLERYEAAKQRYDRYNNILEQAKLLSIPIFNTERFLNFIGYTKQATQPGAFN